MTITELYYLAGLLLSGLTWFLVRDYRIRDQRFATLEESVGKAAKSTELTELKDDFNRQWVRTDGGLQNLLSGQEGMRAELAVMKAKLPNGELKAIQCSLAKLSADVSSTMQFATMALAHGDKCDEERMAIGGRIAHVEGLLAIEGRLERRILAREFTIQPAKKGDEGNG